MIKKIFIPALCSISLLLAGCSGSKNMTASQQIPSLKNTFKNDFGIGTALNTQQIEEKDLKAAELIPQQFNMATPENIMKAEIIHPQWDVYNCDLAEKMIEYGKKNNIKINGHTLIWHSQLPSFARRISSVDSFKTFFANHINTVASRYKGKIFSWEVGNGAWGEGGTMRR